MAERTEEQRTEEEKLFQDGVTVVLGGKNYEIKPLKIRESRKWRGEFADLTGQLARHAKVTTDNPEAFAESVKALLVTMPDQVADLFFDYAQNLDKKAIEEEATDAEVAKAFQEVVALAFPLAGALTEAMTKVA